MKWASARRGSESLAAGVIVVAMTADLRDAELEATKASTPLPLQPHMDILDPVRRLFFVDSGINSMLLAKLR